MTKQDDGAVLFTPGEIGWLEEAAKRARPHQQRAQREQRVASRIVSGVLSRVLSEYRERLPKDGSFEILRDGAGTPLGWRPQPAEPDMPHGHTHAAPGARATTEGAPPLATAAQIDRALQDATAEVVAREAAAQAPAAPKEKKK